MKKLTLTLTAALLAVSLTACSTADKASQPRPVYEEPSSSSFWQPEDVERNKGQ